MTHVHIPKPIHGWRAFFGEIGIIVIGVLLALGAEQLIEGVHHRHQRHISEQAMVRELSEDDGFIAHARFQLAVCLDGQLAAIANAAAHGAAAADVARLADRYHVPPATFDSEAWKAANQSGALLQGGEDSTLDWASHYILVDTLGRLAEQERSSAGPLRAIPDDDRPLDPVQLQAVLSAVGTLREANRHVASASATFLQEIFAAGLRTPTRMVLAEQQAAREAYGECAVPSLTAADLSRRPFPDDPFLARIRAIATNGTAGGATSPAP